MKQTNMVTERKLATKKGTNITISSRLQKLRHANQKKLAFMGVVTNMSVTNKGCMKKYWNTKDIFFILRSMLHFPQLDGNCSMLEKSSMNYSSF